MEVNYTGLRQTPEMNVHAAPQEAVRVMGLGILSGAPMAFVPRVRELFRKNRMEYVEVAARGRIPDGDSHKLKQLGVAAVFLPALRMKRMCCFSERPAGRLEERHRLTRH